MTYRIGFRSKTPLAAFMSLALSTACGSSSSNPSSGSNCSVVDGTPFCHAGESFDGGTPSTSGSGAGSSGAAGNGDVPLGSGSEDEDAGAPFTKPFTSLTSQPVPWSVVIVTITGARIERGEDPSLSPLWQAFAELDLSIQNNDTSDLDYSDRSTWDLELADGSRVSSIGSLGLTIAPGYTAKTTLQYPVNADATLTGAKLVLDGDTRGAAEPELVPLDAKWSSIYPFDVPSLKGKKFAPDVGPYTTTVGELDIDRCTVELNDANLYRTGLGQKWVRLDMTATNPHGTNDFGSQVSGDEFRVIVDGQSSAPSNYGDLLFNVAYATSQNFPVIFEIDNSAEQFDVRLILDSSSQTYHVDLTSNAAAGTSTSAADAGAH